MTPDIDIPLKEPAISAGASDAEQLERARIDASTRVPLLMFNRNCQNDLEVGASRGTDLAIGHPPASQVRSIFLRVLRLKLNASEFSYPFP